MKQRNDALEQARRVIAAIASREGKPVSEVRADMKQAIQHGMSSPDPAVQALWKTVPCAGNAPEPEELILWAMAKLTCSAK